MHQRIGMDQLDRTGRAIGIFRDTAQCFTGRIGQQRAHAFAAIHHAVAHGVVEAGQFRGWGLKQTFERRVDAGLALRLVARDHSGNSASSKGSSASSPSRSSNT